MGIYYKIVQVQKYPEIFSKTSKILFFKSKFYKNDLVQNISGLLIYSILKKLLDINI